VADTVANLALLVGLVDLVVEVELTALAADQEHPAKVMLEALVNPAVLVQAVVAEELVLLAVTLPGLQQLELAELG
jgi:hypothetical protein